MATYRPSFVDISGFTQGLSQGIEADFIRKKQEDALAEAKVDEYLKNYRPDKLRDGDIGEFTGLYNNFKKAALDYKRLDRSGAKPEQLSQAKANMDKALSGLNNIYTNSANAANKAAEYGDYIKRARIAGLDIPQEIIDNYNTLTSGKINEIKVDAIKPAFSYELIKKDADLPKLDYILSNVGAAPVTQSASQKVEVGKVGGKPIYAEDKYTVVSRPVDRTIYGVRLAMGKDNALKRDADSLYEVFKQDPYTYMKDIQKVAPGISYEDVDPATVYALQYFMPKIGQAKRDYTGANMQINSIKFDTDKRYRDAMLAIQNKRLQLSQEAADMNKAGKRNLIDPAKDLTEFEQKNKGKKGWIRVPDTQGYQGQSSYSFQKANVEYIDYNPETNQYRVKTTASDSPKIYSSKETKYIITENTKGATNKPYGDVIPSVEQLESAGYDFNADPELKSLLENMNFSSENEEE